MTMVTSDEAGKSLGGRSRLVGQDGHDLSGGFESVELVAIDQVVPGDRTVSILQLDVEGHEQQALAGALDTIKRNFPIIIL